MTTPTAPAAPAAAQTGQPGVTDLIGHPLAEHERALLEVYTGLIETLGREDLPPCIAANLRAALAPVAVAVTDLGLRFEHLTDLGV